MSSKHRFFTNTDGLNLIEVESWFAVSKFMSRVRRVRAGHVNYAYASSIWSMSGGATYLDPSNSWEHDRTPCLLTHTSKRRLRHLRWKTASVTQFQFNRAGMSVCMEATRFRHVQAPGADHRAYCLSDRLRQSLLGGSHRPPTAPA